MTIACNMHADLSDMYNELTSPQQVGWTDNLDQQSLRPTHGPRPGAPTSHAEQVVPSISA